MANNKIQIKRSTSNATVTGLSNGELAFTQAGNILYVGAPDGTSPIRIGGQMVPGVLTANQALVANSTSGIDQLIVNDLNFTGTGQVISANGGVGNPGDVLFSGGGGGSNLYWASAGTVGVNTAAQYTWSNVHTFQNTVNFLSIVNVATGAVIANSSGVFTTGTANALNLTVGTAFTANSTLVNAAALNVTGQVNTATLFATTSANLASSNVVANTAGLFVANTTGIVNAAVHQVGTAFTANSTLVNAAALNIVGQTNTATLFVTTSANIASSNLIANTAGFFVANSTGVVNAAVHQVGTAFTANSTLVNAAALNIVGQTNTATLFVTTSANLASSNVVANTAGVFVANTTGIVNAAVHQVGTAFIANSTGVYTTGTANALNFTAGANLIINSTAMGFVGNTTTSPNIVFSNTGVLSIGNSSTTQTTSIITVANSAGSANITPAGFFGNGISITSVNATNITNGTLPDARLSAAVVNTSGSFTLAGNNIFGGTNTVFTSNVSMSGANVNISSANLNITSNTNLGGTNTTITSNVTLSGATLTGTATDLSMRNGTFSGNLIVQGSVVTVNTAQLTVNDNIIQLAYTQTTTDTVDSGFATVAGNASAIWYSGIARIAASSNSTAPVFRVFVANTNPNTSATIDTSANTRTGYIQAYLAPYGIGGAFVANASNISINANSTLAVALSVNSIALTTPLPGSNGGTGLSSIANNSLVFGNSTNGFNTLALGTSGYVVQSNGSAIVYDVLDGGTF
jgi:hypothetical protein